MPDGMPPIDPDLIASRITALLHEGRPGAVKPLLAALRKLAPAHRELALLRASYHCHVQEVPDALAVLQEAMALQPDNPALHLRRAEILFTVEDYAGAARDAAEAVVLAPGLARAKCALGLALLALGQYDGAVPCLQEGFAGEPGRIDAALALAALQPENAALVLTYAIHANPRLPELRNALIRRHICEGRTDRAMRAAVQTRAEGAADADTFCLLAATQIEQGMWREAENAAIQAARLAPGNAWAARLQAALAGRPSGALVLPPRPDALAAELELTQGGTILPGTFRQLLAEAEISGEVLDLYCGTGLNAVVATDLDLGPWRGVEPDPVQNRLCAERGLYAELAECDPRGYLRTVAPCPAILLNEALGRCASPESWLGQVRAGLADGGIALAAIPTGDGLNLHGLFGHPPERIAAIAAAAGLECRVVRSGVLRHIEALPLHGIIASFRPR